MDMNEICSTEGSKEGILMLVPSKLTWPQSVDFCRQFGGIISKKNQSCCLRPSDLVELSGPI